MYGRGERSQGGFVHSSADSGTQEYLTPKRPVHFASDTNCRENVHSVRGWAFGLPVCEPKLNSLCVSVGT